MAITNAFRNAVSGQNTRGIRIMMTDSLLVDLSFEEFNQMKNLSADVDGLYDEHDGREFQTDSSSWDDDYMNKLMVQVIGNFSKERIEHLKQVVRYLRPVNVRREEKPRQQTQSAPQQTYSNNSSTQSNRRTQMNYEEQKQYDQRRGNYRTEKMVGGVVAGAVVGGAVAAAASTTVVIGAVVGGVLGATAVVVLTGGE